MCPCKFLYEEIIFYRTAEKGSWNLEKNLVLQVI
jgi:hypothetical protein